MAESYVGKPCPKCKHVRTANEAAPDWQCPKCGVAYAKFLAAQQGAAATLTGTMPAARPGYVAQSAPSGSTGLAIFTHASILIGLVVPLLGIIVPVVVWITQRQSNELAVACAKEALNFQISVLLWSVLLVGVAIGGAVAPPLIWIALALAVVLAILYVILPIVACVKAASGESWRYPLTAHLFS